MMEIQSQKKGQSQRFNARKRGPFRIVDMHDNNTVDIAGTSKDIARVNIERLTKVKMRPEHLLPFVPESVRENSPPADRRESDGEKSDSRPTDRNPTRHRDSDDDAHDATDEVDDNDPATYLQPIRRSNRIRKPTSRLIEVLLMREEECRENAALHAIRFLFQ